MLISAQTMEMPLRYRLQIGKSGRSVEHKKLLDEIWPHGDKDIQFGHNTLKQDRELKWSSRHFADSFASIFDVDDFKMMTLSRL